MITLEEVLAEITKNNRVCPQPQKWQQLYEMLPDKKRSDSGWKPSLPLILSAWSDTPAMSKIIRLREHIEWAKDHECLPTIFTFLVNLLEKEWHHIGE